MLDLATFLSALGCGLIAGLFFAFSAVVMKALGKLPPAQGIAAMQSINVVVINPWFLTALRVGRLSHSLDGLEPRADGSSARRRGRVHPRTPIAMNLFRLVRVKHSA